MKKYLLHQYTQYNAGYTQQTHLSQLPDRNCRPLEWDEQQPQPPSLKLQCTIRREQLFNLEILKNLEGKNAWVGLESRLNSLYGFNKEKLAFLNTYLIRNKSPTALKSINRLKSEHRNRTPRVVSEKVLGNSKCEGAAKSTNLSLVWDHIWYSKERQLFPCFGIKAAYQNKGQTGAGWISVDLTSDLITYRTTESSGVVAWFCVL